MRNSPTGSNKLSGRASFLLRSCSSAWRLPLSQILPVVSLARLTSLQQSLYRREISSRRIDRQRARLISVAVLGWLLMGLLECVSGPITVQNYSGITWDVSGVTLEDGETVTLGSSSQTILLLHGPTDPHYITNSATATAWVALTAPEAIVGSEDGDKPLTTALVGFFLVAGWNVVGIMFKMVARIRSQGPEGIVG
jgi:hypothetical protein